MIFRWQQQGKGFEKKMILNIVAEAERSKAVRICLVSTLTKLLLKVSWEAKLSLDVSID